MPAHITHTIFAERAIKTAIRSAGNAKQPFEIENLFKNCFNYLILGAQGPDMFLHNQRTEPSAFEYGKLLHRRGYGRFIRHMAEKTEKNLRESRNGNRNASSFHSARVPTPSLVAFLLAYTTHAILDRFTHPYIIYFSGWVDPEDPSSKRYHQMHAFFERILDVLVLKKYGSSHERGQPAPFTGTLAEYDFFSIFDCGESLPAQVRDLLVHSLISTYGSQHDAPAGRPEQLARKVSNAYLDTRYFYELTNPPGSDDLSKAYELDRESDFRVSYLALFHPHHLSPSIDFANTTGSPWYDPCTQDCQAERRQSFYELFESAEKEAAGILISVLEVLQGKRPAEELEEIVGNQNLDNGYIEGDCIPRRSDPLPLPEMVGELYRRFTQA
ncbi:MAG: zinc dependent phospholipase C family protein [Spirochaetales bacterium]|nr:zinc dependent phospholipase C family protein [Spirochaetales bacterium]MCF7938369.1 zinc dependent phospholipase C family protein [Spirochaetales bacterium]